MHRLTMCLTVAITALLPLGFTVYRRTPGSMKKQCMRLCKRNKLSYGEMLAFNGNSVKNTLLFLRCFYK